MKLSALCISGPKNRTHTLRRISVWRRRIGEQIAGAIASAQLFIDLKKTEAFASGKRRTVPGTVRAGSGRRFRNRYVDGSLRHGESADVRNRRQDGGRDVGHDLPAMTHPDDRHLHEEKAALLLAGKIAYYTLEKRYIRKDGGIVWADVTVSPLWKPGETPGSKYRRRSGHHRAQATGRGAPETGGAPPTGGEDGGPRAIGGRRGPRSEQCSRRSRRLFGLLLEKIPEGSPLRKYVSNIQQSGEKGAAIIQDLLTLARRGVAVSEVIDLNRIVCDYFKTPEFENLKAYHPLSPSRPI